MTAAADYALFVRLAPPILALLLLICSPALQAQTPPVPPASAAPPEDGQWVMPAKNFASTRYSGLDEINTGNVGKLQVAFTFETGTRRGQEASPIVVNNTMYVLTPFPNILYALDLTKPGASVKWKYEPHPAPPRRASLAVTRSIVGPPMPTAAFSSTRWMPARSQWMRRAAAKSGGPGSAASVPARR
jgi:hypothetical protein